MREGLHLKMDNIIVERSHAPFPNNVIPTKDVTTKKKDN